MTFHKIARNLEVVLEYLKKYVETLGSGTIKLLNLNSSLYTSAIILTKI